MLLRRRVWIQYPYLRGQATPTIVDAVVTGVKQLLPRGPVAADQPSAYDGIREQDLIQIYTDPGGLRTVAVADVHLKRPSR